MKRPAYVLSEDAIKCCNDADREKGEVKKKPDMATCYLAEVLGK